MTHENITRIRLESQQISNSRFHHASDLVSWMGAIQAQDYAMSKLALGIRLSGTTDQDIEEAFETGSVFRTHLLRPTWHLVSAKDIHWILELTAPHIRNIVKTRQKQLELTPGVLSKSLNLISKALEGGKDLTREELMLVLNEAGIPAHTERAAHIMFWAELEALVCSGGKKQTYSLLSEKVPNPERCTREEALGRLAFAYFRSHGPCTISDFSWWSGLSVKDSKTGLETIRQHLESKEAEDCLYYFSPEIEMPAPGNEMYLLPAFDEYIISYKNRTASLSDVNKSRVLTNNGIFKPVIVVKGKVIGTWKRAVNKDKLLLTLDYFEKPSLEMKKQAEIAATTISRFTLGLKLEINQK